MAIASHAPASVGMADTLMGTGIFAAGANALRKRFFNNAAPKEDVQPSQAEPPKPNS
jgi:hypothetical protein